MSSGAMGGSTVVVVVVGRIDVVVVVGRIDVVVVVRLKKRGLKEAWNPATARERAKVDTKEVKARRFNDTDNVCMSQSLFDLCLSED